MVKKLQIFAMLLIIGVCLQMSGKTNVARADGIDPLADVDYSDCFAATIVLEPQDAVYTERPTQDLNGNVGILRRHVTDGMIGTDKLGNAYNVDIEVDATVYTDAGYVEQVKYIAIHGQSAVYFLYDTISLSFDGSILNANNVKGCVPIGSQK